MTAFGIGVGHVHGRGAGSRATADGLRVILDWIPIEVLGAYAALITSLGARGATGATAPGWVVLFCLLAAVTTVLGATTALRDQPVGERSPLGRGLVVRALVSAVALFVWSWMLPGTATNRSQVARDSGAAVVVLVLLCAVVLGLGAQFLVEMVESPRAPLALAEEPVGQSPVEEATARKRSVRRRGFKSAQAPKMRAEAMPPADELDDIEEVDERPVAPMARVVKLNAPVPALAPPAVGDEGPVEESAALPRLLCASYLALTAIGDGPLPDSPSSVFLAGATPAHEAEARIVSAWGSDVRCLVVNTLDGVVVAFGSALPDAGSDAKRACTEWIGAVDSDLIVHRWFAGRVHAGFVTELDRVWDRLDEQIRLRMMAAGPQASLWLTGHGLGGGLAHLAAARIAAQSFHRTLRVRTFGAARSGDGEFATAYEKLVPDSMRLEFGNDLVPHLPLGSEFGTRLGNLEFIDQLGVYLHRDFHPVGELRYTAIDGSVTGDSDRLMLNRHRALAGIITTGNFSALITDHEGRPGGGYFRTVAPAAPERSSTDLDGPGPDPDDPGPHARRWRRPRRDHQHLRSVEAAAGGH